MQGGGKAVTLEPLTQAERNLFYSIRAYARFREQFNVAVAIGTNTPSTLASAIAPPTPRAARFPCWRRSASPAPTWRAGSSAYLSVLYRECDLATDQKWAHDLEEFLKIIGSLPGRRRFLCALQVDAARSTYLQAKNTVLADKQFVDNSLDQFKLVLGMPANLPLILDDTPARPITRQYDHYYEVIGDSGARQPALEKAEKQELLDAKEMPRFFA